jgi:hypothetical protein
LTYVTTNALSRGARSNHPTASSGARRVLSRCLGDICGVRVGGHSIPEFFTTAAYHIIKTGADATLESYTQALDKRVHAPDGRHIKPDYMWQKTVVEFDDWYYHNERASDDTRKTEALSQLGYTVIRFRDDLPDITGAINYTVYTSGSLEDIVAQVCAHVDSEFTRQLWIRVDSLARRAMLYKQQKGASVQQTSITQFCTKSNAHQ